MFQDKKIAVGLFGVHYQKELAHWMGWKPNVDYKTTIENNREALFNNFNAHFYSSTYFSSVLNDLINDYKFEYLKLKHINNVKQNLEDAFFIRNSIFLDTINLIIESNHKYDYVLLMRYDMYFKQKSILDLINPEKINFICRAKWGVNENLIDDNFYFMPYNKLLNFYCEISKIPKKISSHEYCNYIDNNEIHYLIDGKYYSHEIPIYSIMRN